ncbi:MAG: hypothetical protein HFG75_13615 [Hungatella sp.]|nr:hypothetical protein [Hungatella sp.]
MRTWFRRKAGLLLSFTLVCGMVFPYLPARKALADTGVVEAWGDGWHYLCIDGFGYAPNGVCSNGDKYARVSTEEALNSEERRILFWALLSYQYAAGVEEAVKAVSFINQGAEGAGLKRIGRSVTEADLKAVIHSPAVRAQYDWLDFAAAHDEEYLRLAGLLGGGETLGGGTVPVLLQDAVSLSAAARGIAAEDGFVLEFDPSGKDGDFIEKVPLTLSADREIWQAESVNGWNVEKSLTEIRLTNPNPEAGPIYLKFDPAGTEYASSAGGFSSPDECYIDSIEVWKCIQCCGTHFAGGKLHPLEEHQRNVTMEIHQVPVAYYAAAGGSGGEWDHPTGEVRFQVYRHEEDMEADYLVQLYKYDYETGKPLEGVSLDLYERFDDQEKVSRERDGRGKIYIGGAPYEGGITHSPVCWDGFRLVTSVRTDARGRAAYKAEKTYHYDKTFCDGHPAPVFAQVPEEAVNEETGEADNQSEIEEAMAVNAQLALKWLSCVEACEDKAGGGWEGVHFHWIMDEVDSEAIEEAAESGEFADAGATESADGETAFRNSGCRQDVKDTYEAFTSMKYSYTFVETMAREGYVLHGLHRDDVPIEIITTDSSQNGANAVFGGGYSDAITAHAMIGTLLSDQRQEEEDRQEPATGEDAAVYYTEEIRSMRTDQSVEAKVPGESRILEDLPRKARRRTENPESYGPASGSNGVRKKTASAADEARKKTASVSDGRSPGRHSLSTASDGERTASASDGTREKSLRFSVEGNRLAGISRDMAARLADWEGDGTEMFSQAYREAQGSASQGDSVEPGPSDRYSHSSGRDGEEEAFRIYDHRTEGEIHINKQDMDLYAGQTQGDALLEGAVYGLFAAQDLLHPDGTTGVVFRQNDLVAIGTTDKEGDASFLAITEAPGHTYDYGAGTVVETGEGWNKKAPINLYVADEEKDDYIEDKAYARRYLDFQSENGSCWIGRPLLLGSYYVKELSRSEGYELSVNGRNHEVSNYGYSLEVTIPRGQGSAAVTRAPYVEPQSSGKEEDTMPNVIHFAVSSQGTGEEGYDMVLDSFPKGSRLYRKDVSVEEVQHMAGTGKMVKRYLFDLFGQPVYRKADADHTYVKQNSDGTFMTRETAVSRVVPSMGSASIRHLDEEIVKEILDGSSEEEQLENKREADLDGTEGQQFLYLKWKTERALRANGYRTPSKAGEGGNQYSDQSGGVYDRGVREGETDREGLSGVRPGEEAVKTVYGYPVVNVEVKKNKSDGTPLTMEEMILSLLDFYARHPWYSFGGVDGYEETADGWRMQMYAGVVGNPDNYIVLAEQEEESTIFHRLPWVPSDSRKSPRWVYGSYAKDPAKGTFGTYEGFRSWQVLGLYRCSAVLVSDGVVEGDGTIRSKTVRQNVYYEKGEILRDAAGNPLQAYEWEEEKIPVTQKREVCTWTEILLKDKGGKTVGHVPGDYRDAYGVSISDQKSTVETVYKLVLPQTAVTLREEDLDHLPPDLGYEPGEVIGAGDYALKRLGAKIFVYLDYETQTMAGDSLYVKPVNLTYPGQDYCFQDGDKVPGEGTEKNPVKVEERVIRQAVKIVKTVQEESGEKRAVDNFRFKVYLKSNLQRLYRDEEGTVVWLDKKGQETDPEEVRTSFPALVPQFYTKAPHRTDPLSKHHLDSVIANEILYESKDGIISDSPGRGYTKVLEILEDSKEKAYNYEKFFDAIAVANQDKWKDQAPSHTSHRPLGNQANRSGEAEKNSRASDNVRQFAIDWYLDREVKKLTEAGEGTGTDSAAYSDHLYDQALQKAIEKSENYLKPFFSWNLDRIYAIEWDSERGGGKDRDPTTLSADGTDGDRCLAVARYLPYGIYVVVEQQPMYAGLEDLKNRHYDTDKPEELLVPSVYEGYDQACGTPKKMSSYYEYHMEESPESQAAKYRIRFLEESHVIKAHNRFGDFQIYKYGMDMGNVVNGVHRMEGESEGELKAEQGDTFALTQSLYKPHLNYYNSDDDRTAGIVPYYLTEGMSGREGVSALYRYSSVSEHGEGKTMTGASVAVDGTYAHALVPWTMKVSDDESTDMEPEETGESRYRGSAYGTFTDIPYKARLRIEKLDSETHENLLHDSAIFAVYRAARDESPDGEGRVKVYEEETLVAGSREFLKGLGASNITRASRGDLPAGLICTGLVPAGTPVCEERDQVIMTDRYGNKTGEFKAFTTARDGLLEDSDRGGFTYGDQNTGYLETPQELAAGVYVLVEISPPAGYSRTKPVAVEIYSDKTAYYQEGDPAERVLAAVFDRINREEEDRARIYVENAPIKVRIEKRKKVRDQITYPISGRVEGTLAQIGGNPSYEYAYSHGTYLGYGWRKGTLEYLNERKEAGEQVDIVYQGGVFAGYGYITRSVDKTEEETPYVAGALMTLYQGLKLKPSGDHEDYGYEGLTVERSLAGNVTRMYVREGFGGTDTEFLEETDEDGNTCWNGVTVERPNTDILYYDLGDLDLFTVRTIDGRQVPFGYNENHEPVNLEQLENDRRTIARTDREHSVYGFKGGIPFLEIAGGDFTDMAYSAKDKILTVPKGTRVYHLDRDGSRDAWVDPHTGMAYVPEDGTENRYVWPVRLTKDHDGRIVAADKIATCRIGTIGEGANGGSDSDGQEEGFVTGSWDTETYEGSHKMYSVVKNQDGDDQDQEPLLHGNEGDFDKTVKPVVDEHGLTVYYPGSGKVYEKDITLYDRDGDYVREKTSDLLSAFDRAAYRIGGEGDPAHRLGESYLLENTWITGEETPNDPFDVSGIREQADLLKRVPAGTYIMEEIRPPKGYVRGIPEGLTVREMSRIQSGEMEDDRIKVVFRKLDASSSYEYQVLDMGLVDETGGHVVADTVKEGKGGFGHGQVAGAQLALIDEEGQRCSEWRTEKEPRYVEELPAGTYVLREEETPDGFVSCGPKTVEIETTDRVQVVDVCNDHTKVEVEKYALDGEERIPVRGAGFTLYRAVTHEDGSVVYKEGCPLYEKENPVDSWESGDGAVGRGFAKAFEEMYRQYGTRGRRLSWTEGEDQYQAEYLSHRQIDGEDGKTGFPASAEILFSMTGDKVVRITVYGRQDGRQGPDFTFEYQFDYRKLPKIGAYAVSYETLEGVRRLDYLPVNTCYVLVETNPPKGFGKAPDRVISVEDTAQIQRHRILNEESRIVISKCAGVIDGEDETPVRELPGAHMALYRAGDGGEFIQDPEHLAARWVSGTDGVYTENDWINGRILEGYKKGDLKPHPLTRLPDGIYYLAELESPAYYTRMEPVKIVYSQEEQIRIIRVRNHPVRGELELFKRNRRGEPLDGALFQLAAYRDGDLREPVFTRSVSCSGGNVRVSDLPAGEQRADGTILPYEYRLTEIIPPEGYSTDMQIHSFRFTPDGQGGSYGSGQKAEIILELVNEKTRVVIGKKNFDDPGVWVPGAWMEVCQVIGRDEAGQYLCREEPDEVWVTGPESDHVLEGLTAGQTYLLREKKAPEGYEKMEPVAFTLSADGRRITAISGLAGTVTVHGYEDSDVIRSVEIQGRYGVKTEMKAEDEQGRCVAVWTAGGDGHVLGADDGIREDAVYCLTETTIYSDGSREVTGRTTRRAHLSADGLWEISDRAVSKVCLQLTHEDGTVIESWNPSEMIPSREVDNPARPQSPRITIENQPDESGQSQGGGLRTEEPVWVTVSCTNTTRYRADMTVMADPGDGAEVIDPGQGVLEDGHLQYVLRGMEPGECRNVRYVCQLEEEAEAVSVSAQSRCMGITAQDKVTVPVLRKNRLIIFHQVTGTGKDFEPDSEREFQVFLYTADGEELRGRYEYTGSREGSVKSGGYITLSANEYAVIDPGAIYRDFRYEVRPVSREEMEVRDGKGQAWAASGACAVCSREVIDRKQGAVFTRGSRYQLLETTCYSDGSKRDSGKVHFLLGDQASIEAIWALDRKQKASVSKLELTGHRELKGARMQVLTEDRDVVEEWISTEAPHLLEAVLEPGKTYILHEEAAPMGYSYAEEIWFQAAEGEFVTQVVMEDRVTRAVISKKGLTGEEELPGAAMEVRDLDGNVLEQWISGTEPYEIQERLKAGETYILHEEAAPEGYAYAEDVPFTVSMDGRTDKVEMRDAPTRVEISKTDVTGSRELPGAVLQVIDQEGDIVEEWISGKDPHKITGKLRAGETYILREEAPPDGWAYAQEITFRVSVDGSVDRVEMRDDVTRLEIRKVDQKSGLLLAGARFELMTKEMKVVETWISTEEAYRIEGRLKAGETYILREKKSPSGYRNLNQDLFLTIPKKAELLTITVENKRKPSGPGTSVKIEKKKTGRVYADYDSAMRAHGRRTWQTFTNLSLPRLGDERDGSRDWPVRPFSEPGAWLVGILSLLAVTTAGVRKRRVKKTAILLCLCLFFGLAMVMSVYAETVEVKPEGEIVVTGDLCVGEDVLPPALPKQYRYGEAEYEQISCQLVTAMTEGGTKEVEKVIVYESVEQADTLPETAKITVTDERYKKEYIREFPILDVEFYNWRWIQGFEFPITVEDADADEYDLGGVLVPADGDHPFEGYENQVLGLISADPAYYRVLEVTWSREPWIGEDHKVYRQAMAVGEKYVADCRAVYGGEAVLEPMEGVAWQAVYRRAWEEPEISTEPPRSRTILAETETGTEEPETLPEESAESLFWYQTLAGELVISAGILFLIVLAAIPVIWARQKRKKSLKK